LENANTTMLDSTPSQHRSNNAFETISPYYSVTVPVSSDEEDYLQGHTQQHRPIQQQQLDSLSPLGPQSQDPLAVDSRPLDIFYPFFDPQMIGLFPNGEMPDISPFETSSLGLNYPEIEGWNMDLS
jgi:hypothetical protein